jgi:hypothetical protein
MLTELLEVVGGLVIAGGFVEGVRKRAGAVEDAPAEAGASAGLTTRTRAGRARTMADYGTSRAPDRRLLRDADREAELLAAEVADGYDPASAEIPY